MGGGSPKHGIKFTDRVNLKLTKEQKALLLEAISLSDDAWRGISHHARQAVINWARGVLAHKHFAAKRARG
jgi:hypothetical protein